MVEYQEAMRLSSCPQILHTDLENARLNPDGEIQKKSQSTADRMGPVGGRSLEAGEGPEVLEGHGVPPRNSLTFLDGALGLGILGVSARLVLALAGPAIMLLLLFLMLSFLTFDLIHGPQELPLPRRPMFRPLGLGAGGEGPRLREPLLPPTLSHVLDGFLLLTGLGLILGAVMPFSIFSLVVSLWPMA
ncbi:uncharacterized protein C20orf141 homolog [Gracilinanus agilis]|uniref:uncharacterized protein C20orf141 homolog n=1 Tax=Gracilinanus agilis TaxID=191870 RepID=UPI001CFD7BC2|nr:uncharacterized protein C20orf141 homolog [Gracilinanus agilis]